MRACVRKRRIAPAAMRTVPMLVTDDGMVTELRLEQLSNAPCARTAADARRECREAVLTRKARAMGARELNAHLASARAHLLNACH